MSARTDLWEPWESNLPRPPGPISSDPKSTISEPALGCESKVGQDDTNDSVEKSTQ